MSQLSSFEILPEDDEPEEHCGILPVYPSTEKLNQKFFRKLMQGLFSSEPEIPEVLPASIRERYGLLERPKAFYGIHFPADFSELKAARGRLAFEELYLIQCGLMIAKNMF